MKIKFFSRTALRIGLCALAGIMFNAHAAPILSVEDGKLVGAKGVMVSGKAYDVRFAGGTCTEVFGTCTSAAFFFHDMNMARAASQALSDQVFINGPVGEFDKYSNLTEGCETYLPHCFAFTPAYLDGSTVVGSSLLNYSGRSRSEVYLSYYQGGDTPSVKLTYAQWSIPGADLPEPGTSVLLAIALSGLVFVRRRTSRVSVT